MINADDINMKTNKIYNIVEMLDRKVEKINIKIKEINDIYMKYEFNKNLDYNQSNTYLRFQAELLQNEKKYYTSIKKTFFKKFIHDLYEISDFVILILISMDDLDIGLENEKFNIKKKILKSKKQNVLDIGKILELINITMNNLGLTKEFIDLFENFINETDEENKKKNIHSKNMKVNLMNKKNHLEVEYKKYSAQLNELVNYFYEFCCCMDKQLSKQELLQFFIKK